MPVPFAVPPEVDTLNDPVVAPGITMATTVFPLKLMGIAATPPMLIAVGLFKLVPVMVTRVPAGPLLGANEFIVGAGGIKIKPESAADPPAAVRLRAPVAPLPTMAEMVVADKTWKDVTDIPPNVIAVVVFKLVPVIVMVAPVPALEGVKEVIVGALMVGSKETLTIKLAPEQLPAIGLIV